MSGEPEQEWEKHKEYKGESAVLKPDHCQNTDDLTCICKHTDDAGSEKVFYGIDISYKSGYQSSWFLVVDIVCCKVYEFLHQTASESVDDLLSEDSEQTFSCGFHQSGNSKHEEI